MVEASACGGDTESLLQCQDLNTLDAALQSLNEERLRSQRTYDRLLAHRDAVARGTAPIHCLTVDILRAIFETGWESEADVLDEPSKEPMQFSILIASVCRLWREIACSVSKLWSVVAICADRNPLPSLETFLPRSGNQKLQIAIVGTCDDEGVVIFTPMELVWVFAAMHVLVEHQSQWETLIIEVASIRTIDLALSVWKAPAQCLKTLVLCCGYHSAAVPDQSIVFPPAPDLRRLIVTLPCMGRHTLSSTYPSLEQLDIAAPFPLGENFGVAMESLQPLRQLRKLTIGSLLCEPLSPNAQYQIHFATLESLSLQPMLIDQIYDCLSVLEAPLLTDLHLDIEPEPFHRMHTSPLIPHPQRFPLLRSVFLHGLPDAFSLNSVSSFLGYFTTVKLLFVGNRLEEFLESAAQRSPSGEWSFPRLTSLTVSYYSSVPSKLLRQLVEARRTASLDKSHTISDRTAQIKNIQVNTSAELHADERQWFEANLRKFTWSKDEHPCMNGWIEFVVTPP